MAEEYSEPIETLITRDVIETVSTVTVGGGYPITITSTEDVNEDEHQFNVPAHLKAIVVPRQATPVEEPSQGTSEYIRPYQVLVWVLPSETDGKPIMEYIDTVGAAVLKALLRDDNLSYLRGGFAFDTREGGPPPVDWFKDPDKAAYQVVVNVDVQYQTGRRNKFKKVD